MSEASANPAPKPRPRKRLAAPPAQTTAVANLNSSGQALAIARQQRGLSIEQVADMLKIRRVYLEAIEHSDWDNLPELVYAQGFVRSYAAFLDLDVEVTTAQFKREFRGGSRRAPELDMPQPLEDQQLPNWKIIAIVIVTLLVIYSIWAAANKPRQNEPVPRVSQTQTAPEPAAVPQTPPPVAAEAVQPIAPAPVATAPEPEPAPQLPNGIAYGNTTPTRITITAAQDSWVQIRDTDGQVVFSRVMRPGDSFRVPEGGNLSLTTGNLAGLNFAVDGKNFAPQGTPGTVLRNLPLTAENLPGALANFTRNPAPAPVNTNADVSE